MAFSSDTRTYDIDSQFMWGETLLFAPQLWRGETARNVYLPKNIKSENSETFWYDFYSYESYTGGRDYRIPADELTPIFIKSGTIFHKHRMSDETLTLDYHRRNNNMSLIVALDSKGNVENESYYITDDGKSRVDNSGFSDDDQFFQTRMCFRENELEYWTGLRNYEKEVPDMSDFPGFIDEVVVVGQFQLRDRKFSVRVGVFSSQFSLYDTTEYFYDVPFDFGENSVKVDLTGIQVNHYGSFKVYFDAELE